MMLFLMCIPTVVGKQKDSVCEALEQVFGQFPKHHITVLLIVNTFLEKENIFKPTVWNLSLHGTTNDGSAG